MKRCQKFGQGSPPHPPHLDKIQKNSSFSQETFPQCPNSCMCKIIKTCANIPPLLKQDFFHERVLLVQNENLFCPYLFISQGYKPGRKYSAPKTKVGCVGGCLALETGSPYQGSPPSHRSSSDHLGPQRKYIHRHDFQFLVSDNIVIKMIFNFYFSVNVYIGMIFNLISQNICRSRCCSVSENISVKTIFNPFSQNYNHQDDFQSYL